MMEIKDKNFKQEEAVANEKELLSDEILKEIAAGGQSPAWLQCAKDCINKGGYMVQCMTACGKSHTN